MKPFNKNKVTDKSHTPDGGRIVIVADWGTITTHTMKPENGTRVYAMVCMDNVQLIERHAAGESREKKAGSPSCYCSNEGHKYGRKSAS